MAKCEARKSEDLILVKIQWHILTGLQTVGKQQEITHLSACNWRVKCFGETGYFTVILSQIVYFGGKHQRIDNNQWNKQKLVKIWEDWDGVNNKEPIEVNIIDTRVAYRCPISQDSEFQFYLNTVVTYSARW